MKIFRAFFLYSFLAIFPSAHAAESDCMGTSPDGLKRCTQPRVTEFGYDACVSNSLTTTIAAEGYCTNIHYPLAGDAKIADWINCVNNRLNHDTRTYVTPPIAWKPEGSTDPDAIFQCYYVDVVRKYGMEMRGFARYDLNYRTYARRTRSAQCPRGYLPGPTSNGYPDYCVSEISETTAEPEIPSCDGKQPPKTVGNPLHIATGEKQVFETDYPASGGSPLEFRRSYSNHGYYRPMTSASTVMPGFGDFWRHNYDRRVYAEDQPYLMASAIRPGGVIKHFRHSGEETLNLDGGSDRLVQQGDGWLYQASNGELEAYDSSGRLLRIIDTRGHIQTLTYSDAMTDAAIAPSAGLLIQVTDDHGRSLHFNYDGFRRMRSMTDPDGQIYTYTFNSIEMLTRVDYPDGKFRRYQYNNGDTGERGGPYAISEIIDENGTVFARYRYSDGYWNTPDSTERGNGVEKYRRYPSENSISVIDPLGSSRTYQLQKIGGVSRIVSQSQPAGSGCASSASKYGYDNLGNVTHTVDFNGYRSCYAYVAGRNLETVRLEKLPQSSNCPGDLASYEVPAGNAQRKISTEWHPDFSLPVRRATPKLLTSWIYNGQPDPTNGQSIASCAPASAQRTDGNPIAVLCKQTEQPTTDDTGSAGFAALPDGEARVSSYTYNEKGQVLTVTDSLGHTTVFAYYGNTSTDFTEGDLQSVSNAAGHVTRYPRYNARGHALQVIDPNGISTELTYHPRGWLLSLSVMSADGGNAQTTTYSYDGAGQLIKITLPDGSYLSYSYDSAHRLTGVADSSGNRIAYALDGMGNRTREDVYNPSGSLKRTQSRIYDALSRLQEVRGANGQSTRYGYDPQGNRIFSTEAGSFTNRATYDALGRLLSMTDPAGGQTRFSNDARDWPTSVTDPKGLTTTYEYNAFGAVVHQVSPDTGVTTYTHDVNGNRLSMTNARGITTTYSYDALNRITKRDYPGTAEDVTYFYDGSNYERRSPISDGTPNGLGRLTGIEDEVGTTAFAYDAYGNLRQEARVVQKIIYRTYYEYDSRNQLKRMTYPNGRVLSFERNVVGRITRLSTQLSGFSVVLAENIDYLPFGPESSWILGNGLDETRVHDQDYRVSRIQSGVLQDLSYFYDARNNIDAIQNGLDANRSQSFDYDGLSRLTGAQGFYGNLGYTYDANGNRLSATDDGVMNSYTYSPDSHRLSSISQGGIATTFAYDAAGNVTGKAAQSYSYNAANRMSQATSSSGSASYVYNARGQRIIKSDRRDVTIYHYDQYGNLIAETDKRGNVQKEYVYLNGKLLAQFDYRKSKGKQLVYDTYYYHLDHLSTPQIMSASNGQLVWRADYEPFGAAEIAASSATQNHRFPGQYADSETGLHDNWWRSYDHQIGRYLQSDPIGLDGGLNTYAYVSSNPIRNIDPLGLYEGMAMQHCFAGSCTPEPVPPPEECPCPTPPLAPTGESCERNIAGAEDRNIFWTVNQVRNHHPWDYKRSGYEDFGNFNYGAAFGAAGFPQMATQRLAGVYGKYFGAYDPVNGNPWGDFPYGDFPNDQRQIARGYQYYRCGCYQ